VLVCVDTAGRVLELAHMVDHLWQIQDSGLLAYSLAVLNNVSYNVIEFAKSQIEWMSEKLMRNFEGKRNNPFQFRHLKLCHSMSELNKVPSPKVVLASMPDLESGFGRELFLMWGASPKNSVILTSRTSKGTLARDLIDNGSNRKIKVRIEQRQSFLRHKALCHLSFVSPTTSFFKSLHTFLLQLEVKKRVKLTGAELDDFRRREREEAGKSKALESMLDDESSDEEMDSAAAGGDAPVKRDIIAKPDQGQKASSHSGFFKESKNKFAMYPYHQETLKWDEYGEHVRRDEFADFRDGVGPTAESQIDEKDDEKNIYGSRVGGGGAVVEEDPDYTEVPTKCVSEMQTIHVKAQIHYIDFEGESSRLLTFCYSSEYVF
jgi:cleavage and polyadenylation specificity factor subunit 2